MIAYNENLVRIPGSDNVWVDPLTVRAVQKNRPTSPDGNFWVVIHLAEQIRGEGQKFITIYFNTSEECDAAIAAITPDQDSHG